MNLVAEATELLEQGATRTELQRRLEISELHAGGLVTLWRKRKGMDQTNHPEKVDQAHRLIHAWRPGARGLRIYETCAYKGETGELGYMNQAWQQYGTVVACGPHHGKAERLIPVQVEQGAVYDVVDNDVYGLSNKQFEAGLVKLVAPGGLLVCSWGVTSTCCLHQELLHRLFGHGWIPSCSDLIRYTVAQAKLAGRKAVLPEGMLCEKYGSLWRIPMVIL